MTATLTTTLPTTIHAMLPATKSKAASGLAWTPEADNDFSPVLGVLALSDARGVCRYRVESAHSEGAWLDFVLCKLDAGTDATAEHYTCSITQSEHVRSLCGCRGFTFTKGCKHLAALTKLMEQGQI